MIRPRMFRWPAMLIHVILLIAFAFLLLLVSCSGQTTNATTRIPNTATPSFSNTAFPTQTMFPMTTTESLPSIEPTNTVIPAVTESSLPAILIGPERLFYPFLKIDVPIFYWSDDGNKIIYAYRIFGYDISNQQELKWAIFDIENDSISEIETPFTYDRSIWMRLNIPAPSMYPQLDGYVSPSGKYIVYVVKHGKFGSDPDAKSEIWLASIDGQENSRLLSLGYHGEIGKITWFRDESKFIFSFGYEGPPELYVAEISAGTTYALSNISEYRGGFEGEQGWSLSTDETQVAISGQDSLWIVPLDSGKAVKIGETGSYPYWAKGGKLLYYWQGTTGEVSLDKGTNIRLYDPLTSTISTFVDIAHLSSTLGFVPYGAFAVSPDHQNIIGFWGDQFWMVRIIP